MHNEREGQLQTDAVYQRVMARPRAYLERVEQAAAAYIEALDAGAIGEVRDKRIEDLRAALQAKPAA